MEQDQNVPRRRALRLREYDYSAPGAYFVTVCTYSRYCLLGEISSSAMHLSDVGTIVQKCWQAILIHFAGIHLDDFIVMPNHIHGIVMIGSNAKVGARHASPLLKREVTRRSLGVIIGSFKSAVSKQLHIRPIWQRNYYEHVIRNEASLQAIREYIRNNPAQWDLDCENPINQR